MKTTFIHLNGLFMKTLPVLQNAINDEETVNEIEYKNWS